MNDDTTIVKKQTDATPEKKATAESHFLNVSIRGWVVLMVIATICYMEINKIGISEPLYSMALIMVGFYFGDKKATPTGVQPIPTPTPITAQPQMKV